MGGFLSLPVLLLAAALQASVIPQMRFLSGGPDMVLLIVVSWSIHAKLEESVIWALVGGIMLDLLSSAPTGTSAVGLVLIVFAINRLGSQVYRIGIILLMVLAVFATLVQQTTTIILFLFLGVPMNIISAVNYVVLPMLLYNLIFILPLYGFTRWLQRRTTTERRFFIP